MSKERTNELARKGNFKVAALARLNTDEIDKLCKSFEDQHYLMTDDFITLFAEAIKLLHKIPFDTPAESTTGVGVDIARQVLCALLRVPAETRQVTDPADFNRKTVDEIKKFRRSWFDAARIGKKIADGKRENGASSGSCSYETYHQMLAAASDREQARKLLLAAKADDASVQLPTGEVLPDLTPAPRALSSAKSHTITLKVLCVHEDSDAADVHIICDVDPSAPVLDGLIGKSLQMTFVARTSKIRRFLLWSQMIGKPIKANVGITRALREADMKHTTLSLIKLRPTTELFKEALVAVTQLKFNFEGEEGQTIDPALTAELERHVNSQIATEDQPLFQSGA